MITGKDTQFIRYLVSTTNEGRVRWEPTAQANQFTASFKGKYNVLVDKTNDDYWMKMVDIEGRELLFVTSEDSALPQQLFDVVRRASLNVDAAIDEIIQE